MLYWSTDDVKLLMHIWSRSQVKVHQPVPKTGMEVSMGPAWAVV